MATSFQLFKLILQLDTNLKSGLTTESDVNGIRALVLDDFSHKIGGHGKEIDLVGETFRCLDGGNVGIDENGVDALFFESFNSFGSGIIKFSGLSNTETATTKNEGFLWL